MNHLRVIFGLGNPGDSYVNTRHNIGFTVVDNFAEKFSTSSNQKWQKFNESLIKRISVNNNEILVAKPQTFMNNSGNSVNKILQFYKFNPSEILVVHDELDLNLGILKFKFGGGEAGHNGLKSISSCLGTKDYLRFRFGIGKPEVSNTNFDNLAKDNSPKYLQHLSVSDWVLSNFASHQKILVNELVDTSIDEILSVVKNGYKIN